MLRAAPGDIKAPKPKESHGIDERGNPRRLGRDADLIAIPQNRSGQAEREHGSGMIRDEGLESDSDTSSRSPTKKSDGEFGGMNTGEVEWTEPRDTANSRTKRDKDVA